MARNIEAISYDQENIRAIEKNLQKKLENGSHREKAFTMMQGNNPCEVTVTDESLKKCAKMLIY